MGERRPLIPVVVGPTAVGKTAVALALAEHWPVTVISADSRQIYRGLDIGTAKPTPAERRRVPHLGLDLVDPGERYSAGRYAREAAGWLEELLPAGRPVVVGGTGFYIRALVDGLFREPPMDRVRRESLRRWSRRAEGLGAWAARLDAGYTGGGRQRAARAVEVALLTGRPLSWWQRRARWDGIMRPWYVRLTLPRAVLHRRIAERAERMVERGVIEEVETMLERGVAVGDPGLDAVGYREVVRHLEGRLPRSELVDAIATVTRRYAKRQETWFRHQLGPYPVATLDAGDEPGPLAERIVELWNRSDE